MVQAATRYIHTGTSMSGDIKKKARESAERCIPLGIDNRAARIFAYIDGYMAGHAAHTRWASKTILAYREAKARATHNGPGEPR